MHETVDISTTIDSELDEVFTEIRRTHEKFKKQKAELNTDQEKLKIDRKDFYAEIEPSDSIDNTDVIGLNVGGEIFATTRQTLTLFPKTLVSILFNGRWEYRLPSDDNGNIYFDFNPIVFRHLLDQLQLAEVKKLRPPSDPSLVRSFEKMLKKLGLHYLFSTSHKNIFTINIDGQIMTTINNSFIPSNQSKFFDKTDVFIDHHPKIFRHFVRSRREKKIFEVECENKLFSINKEIFVQSMSNNWRVSCHKHFSMLTTTENTMTNRLIEQNNQQIIELKQIIRQHDDQLKKLNTNDLRQMLHITQTINPLQNNIYMLENRLNETRKQIFGQSQLKANLVWKKSATTTITEIDGSTFDTPQGIYIDNDRLAMYIADRDNHVIVQCKSGADKCQSIVGRSSYGGKGIDELNQPVDVILDRKRNSLIICDFGNQRVVRWSLDNQHLGQVIIKNISCRGLTMNENGDLFVSDNEKHAVIRWRQSEKGEGTIIAGGNGQGNQFNQLNDPGFILVDQQETVYISDKNNHRVIKWLKNAKQGIVIAGGQNQGNSSKQLSFPEGLIVNEVGDIYVVDSGNNRVMCWQSGSNEGHIIIGENNEEYESNQLNGPKGLSFDDENNLYVVDTGNNRIQKFEVDYDQNKLNEGYSYPQDYD